jgi:hypothetical protein
MTEHEKQLITKYDLLFESRLTRVETSMDNIDRRIDNLHSHMNEGFKEIKQDLRWMFSIMLGFSGILLGLMAKGFKWFS